MGEENAYLYMTGLYLAASASAEFFADIALSPMEACKVRIQTSPVGTFPTTLRGLDPHLTGLHGGEGDVGEELSRGRGCQVESGHVEVGVFLSHGVSVNLLKNFIEAELAKTLGRITNHCGSPAKEKARDASLLHGELEAIAKVLVLLLVNLETALDQVKGGDHCVGDSTGENTSKGAESKVLLGSKLTTVFLGSASGKLPQGLLAKALSRGCHWLWEESPHLGDVHPH